MSIDLEPLYDFKTKLIEARHTYLSDKTKQFDPSLSTIGMDVQVYEQNAQIAVNKANKALQALATRPADLLSQYTAINIAINKIDEAIILTIMYAYNKTKVPQQESPNSNTGGSPKLHILGRDRAVIVKGRSKFITYKGSLVNINDARKLEKSLKSKK